MLTILIAAQTFVGAQYQIKSWTTDDGLPQNTVRSILQTPDGYLWLTTLDGLARFDGVRFTIYNKSNTEGFGTNRLNHLIQSPDGDLWIGAETDFVIRRHAGVFTTFALNKNGLPDGFIRNLTLDNAGVPVVFSHVGIFRWNGENFVPFAPLATETGNSSARWSASGAFWYSNENVLHRLANGKIDDFPLPDTAEDSFIVKLYEDRRGRMWIGTRKSGLFVVEGDNLKRYTIADGLPDNDAKPATEDRDGNLWIVTPSGAATLAPDGGLKVITTTQGLSENYAADAFQDREGSIWIGTFRRGISRLTERTINFYSMKDGLAAQAVYSIYQLANDDILLGGGGKTLFHDARFSTLSATEKDIPKSATAITQDRTGRVWFGGWNGAYFYENGWFTDFSGRFGQPSPAVVDIHEDQNGAIWFASNAGLFKYQNDVVSKLTTADNLVSNDVRVIHESDDGALWFGTYGGLSKYQNGEFQPFTVKDGLGSDQIRSIYEDAEKTLWIGSYDSGLTRLKNGKFTRYTTKDGLFNEGVFCILEDDRHNFWMSSNRGIYRVAKQQLNDFADGKIPRIESNAYGKADGLLETECNGGQQPAGIKARDGKLWFPTQNGAAVIDPNNIQTNPVAPPVVIEAAKVDNKTVSVGEPIRIEAGENNLEIDYTGLSFVKPELVTFRYRLEGQDADWVEAGTRRAAYYSYLPPGNYTFRVTAANSDGVWNADGKSLEIVVVPPFYRTWWFSILSVCLIAGAVYLIYRQRINRLENQRRTRENFSREMITSQEKERQRIAAELHDGLGQSLLVIKNRALLGTLSPEDRAESQEQFEEISRASSQAIEEVREIAYNLRPYHLDRLGLTQSIKAMLETINNSTAIEFAFEIMPLENAFPKNEEVIVYRIAQECVNNIIKHSQATEASVLIHRGTRGLTMTIEDNGRGFTPNMNSQTKGGFGLIGIEERVRILGGTLQIRSAPDNGTTIIIKELGESGKR